MKQTVDLHKKSNLRPTSPDFKRVFYLSLFITFLFSLLVIQFYQIQIIHGEYWSKIGDKQHYFIVKAPFHRGKFMANMSVKRGALEEEKSFVIDVEKFHLYADAKSIPVQYKEEVAKTLAELLNFNEEEHALLIKNLSKKSRSRKLVMWIDKELHDALLAWWNPYAKKKKIPKNALFFVADYQRSYPYGHLLGQVLHTIQGVKDEKTNQAIPTGGLELYFHHYLTGKQGKSRLMRSPRNALETGDMLSQPEDGADIYLTINPYLQAIAEEEVEKGVKKSKAKSGWAVIMDPFTGEVLSLAQYPFFDLCDYQKYFNDPLLVEHTKVKAITDANEPGSIMKAITIAVAFKANEELARRGEAPLFDPDAMMPTANNHFAGRSKPLRESRAHKYLNMEMAIQKSSNVYVARLMEKVVQRLGTDWYRNVLYEDFGFGQKTGIELPSESPGLLPRPGKLHPNGHLEWSASTPYSLAMGHNIQTNSLQILRVYAMFANGGYFVKPTLIKKIVKTLSDGSKEVLFDNTLTPGLCRHVISSQSIERIKKAIKYTTKPGGTGYRADVSGYSDSGKTGTGDKAVNGKYDPHFVCSSFVGIVPANKPVFVLIVSIDEPEYGFEPGLGRKHMGGVAAAPVFKEIARRSLEYLEIPKDDPYGYPPGDPRFDKEKADWYPEVKLLQEKFDKWNK